MRYDQKVKTKSMYAFLNSKSIQFYKQHVTLDSTKTSFNKKKENSSADLLFQNYRLHSNFNNHASILLKVTEWVQDKSIL